MAAAAKQPQQQQTLSSSAAAAEAVQRRYEGLMTVRNKAIKGKGAWYWSHLEPMLVVGSGGDDDTCLPKAVKLRCSLCNAVFSASNPSRTASEHLKRGSCPGFFSSAAAGEKPISSVSLSPHSSRRNRKRSSSAAVTTTYAAAIPTAATGYTENTTTVNVASAATSAAAVTAEETSPPLPSGNGSVYHVEPLSIIDPSRFCRGGGGGGGDGGRLVLQPPRRQPHLVLSGGKDDLGALAMLEDSVKKLKNSRTSPTPKLSKARITCAIDCLADWVYESCGSVSFSALEHPKFKAFLARVGLPVVSKSEFAGGRLDVKYQEVKSETEAKMGEANFLQIATNGWRVKSFDKNLVNFGVNLPNGSSLYAKAEFVNGCISLDFAEGILSEMITGICGNSLERCVGIVSDRFKANVLRDWEDRHPWMVNLPCLFRGFIGLIKDFNKKLPLFNMVSEKCLRLASFVNENAWVRGIFGKYQIEERGFSSSLRLPSRPRDHGHMNNFEPMYNLLEDVLNSARTLSLVVLDDAYKLVAMEDLIAREIGEMVGDVGFWNEVDAVHSLVKLVKEMAQRIEDEKPLVGQCIPLWNELRVKVRDWCSNFRVAQEKVEKVIENRLRKSYHPAWAAAFALDPLYLMEDDNGKYLPPFKFLTPEQEKDVDKLITRLVPREDTHVVLMELMKWRTEGLDPTYARAVQMKEKDPITGKMKIANPQGSRLVWETYLSEFKILGRVAVRVIFLHATSCSFKCNPSLLRWVNNAHGCLRTVEDRARKLIFIAANSKLERREFSTDEEKDTELFNSTHEGCSNDITGPERRPP